MNVDKAHKYRERWRELQRQAKDLDWRRSVFAKELRAEFPSGDAGDDRFLAWLRDELDVTGFQANEMFTRAQTATIVQDERTFKMVGGSRAVRWLIDLPKRERVAVIEAAKVERKNIHAVMKSRGLVGSRVSPRTDAERMAEYIVWKSASVPSDILEIALRYAKDAKAAA